MHRSLEPRRKSFLYGYILKSVSMICPARFLCCLDASDSSKDMSISVNAGITNAVPAS